MTARAGGLSGNLYADNALLDLIDQFVRTMDLIKVEHGPMPKWNGEVVREVEEILVDATNKLAWIEDDMRDVLGSGS